MHTFIRAGLPALLACVLTACGGAGGVGSSVGGPVAPGAGNVFKVTNGETATEQMIEAMVTAIPGDVIEFGCGFYDLTSTLQISNTENITIRGCGADKTILSFRKMTTGQVGILGVNVRGLWIRDLTVADTAGNGFELRNVDHGTLSRVRAFWSSGGGREAKDAEGNFIGLSAANYEDGRLDVKCTQPATLDPRSPENEGLPQTESPDYTVSDKAGRYGIYPVGSRNILIEDSESVGASDAGIYVGQTTNTIIRNSRAAFNVFGFEIENVQGGEYHDNISECNTGGFLVYDLDGNLRQYGDRTRMYRNISRKNNTYNFTEGGFVANVPAGSGMITLSYDRIDIFDNEFRDNNTAGIIHTSYAIFPEGDRPKEKRIDFYSEGVHIFRNKFSNNGNSLPLATTKDLYGGDITEADPTDPAEPSPDVARLLPALVGLKSQAACTNPLNALACAKLPPMSPDHPEYAKAVAGFRGAHIVWDGLSDTLDADCDYPTMSNGEPVPADERGKPLHTNEDNPTCHYNAYKFKGGQTGTGERITPDWWFSCIDADNEFAGDSVTFANFHGTEGINGAIALSEGGEPSPAMLEELPGFPSSFDLAPHDCMARYGKNLPLLPPVVIPKFVPSSNVDITPTPAQIKALCEKVVPAGQVNFDAAPVNCPRLDQYNLFSNAEDPASVPNSSGGDSDVNVQGMPFVLNTKLFSDYAVKYRVMFMPTGSKAIYKDAADGGPNATLIFPVGTIIAKTFAFRNETTNTENVVETRLLIKRINRANNDVRWDGVSYIWKTGGDGKRIAELAPTGGEAAVSWDFHDSDVPATRLQGSAPAYQIPNANQCLSCHSREDSEPGSAPIGMKIRNLNRAYKSESSRVTGQGEMPIKGQSQVEWMCTKGLMLNCPADLGVANGVATKLERLPIYNKVGDSGLADMQKDREARARAYLEVNCQHCHNVRGFAASTGLYLNSEGPVGLAYGMCKRPTATGREGSGGFSFDIIPVNSADHSILPFRISPAAVEPAAKMPPLARSVVHTEGFELVRDWINSIPADNDAYPNSETCAGQ